VRPPVTGRHQRPRIVRAKCGEIGGRLDSNLGELRRRRAPIPRLHRAAPLKAYRPAPSYGTARLNGAVALMTRYWVRCLDFGVENSWWTSAEETNRRALRLPTFRQKIQACRGIRTSYSESRAENRNLRLGGGGRSLHRTPL
jgi:hypothetical protein